jgi:host factor-I protein
MTGKTPPPAAPVQQQWLGFLRDRNSAVTLYLRSGIALRGRIAGFDDYALLLAGGDRPCLVYKHAVLTVLPLNPADPFEPAGPEP